ncbi:cation:proton antiporter domain-containing protein [Thiocapsa bogorovii]|uniref:cation:proton antiporter domain-containing protein n=1 Tax=Thiocapsa bogorovii TaxID=521689 RepID=UPI001E645822|nr:cation:proton antiporter [Thiocapsa bogorovii]UHD15685.1 cation:proton antiporter [Thiocapsa bogorovii]
MELSSILLAIVIILAATALCVALFDRLGFGSILGFIVAGVLIGPHTPGPVPVHAVEELQSIAELGVVLFMFTVGLELRPGKVWAMRRLIFGLGSAQMLVSAAALALYLVLLVGISWEAATLVGLAFAMSSTAIVMGTLSERGELASEHGRTTFAILMAQDMWVVPVMALVPVLAHTTGAAGSTPLWQTLLMVVGVIGGILIVGRWLLPAALGYFAGQRQMDAFGLVLFLGVILAAWAVDKVGISMTLGAFLLGMLLSASDLRYQIEASVTPFKQSLMGLFFIAVGMSIDVGAILRDWDALLVQVPAVLALKALVLIGLALAFGIGRAAAIRIGFYLSQVGEFAFVLLGAAAVAGLISSNGHTLAMLVVAVSMIATPLMVKAGAALSGRLAGAARDTAADLSADLERHVVIIGYDEVGQLIALMLERANIPYVAVERDLVIVERAKRAGRQVYLGNMYSPATQAAAGVGKATAVYVTSHDNQAAKALAVTLHQLYPQLDVYVRMRTLRDQDELVSKGIKHAATSYIESTLSRGGELLKNLGVPETEVDEVVGTLRKENYSSVRAAYVDVASG